MSSRERFEELVGWAKSQLEGDEILLARFDGENSDFIRFNGASVRQAGSVRQRSVELELIDGQRHTSGSVSLSEDDELDRGRVGSLLAELRDQVGLVPEDPYLLYATDEPSTTDERPSDIPDGTGAVDRVLDASAGRDLAGIYASGDIFSGYASSLGQRHWFRGATFNFDWSFYLRADKAAKNGYAGTSWDDDAFDAKIAWSSRQLDALAREPIDLQPGRYRTFLAPAAMVEIMDMLSWGGFGLRAHRTRRTPLLRMVTEGATLHPGVTITEDTAGGAAPAFQSDGFTRPDEVVLIDGGSSGGHLVSPRSAQEYGVATNGAESHESPVSVALSAGAIPTGTELDALGTGLYVGNLWYLNFSDRAAGRLTGMTRFATFWVEDGEIVAPVNVLRFDDSIFHLLGDGLVGLTDTAEMILDPGTYGGRSTMSHRVPGALVEAMTFTL